VPPSISVFSSIYFSSLSLFLFVSLSHSFLLSLPILSILLSVPLFSFILNTPLLVRTPTGRVTISPQLWNLPRCGNAWPGKRGWPENGPFKDTYAYACTPANAVASTCITDRMLRSACTFRSALPIDRGSSTRGIAPRPAELRAMRRVLLGFFDRWILNESRGVAD